MKEILVFIACINNDGCTDAATAYYRTEPEFAIMVERVEKDAKAIAGPTLSEYGPPILLAAAKRDFAVRLGPSLFVNMGQNSASITLKWEY